MEEQPEDAGVNAVATYTGEQVNELIQLAKEEQAAELVAIYNVRVEHVKQYFINAITLRAHELMEKAAQVNMYDNKRMEFKKASQELTKIWQEIDIIDFWLDKGF